MFDALSQRLQSVWDSLRRQPRITEDLLKDVLREVRIALIEADVALPVVKPFITAIQEKALGQDILKSLNPDQMVIKIVFEHLLTLLGEAATPLILEGKQRPHVYLLVGLQGAGKTTTAVKLGVHLTQKHQKNVSLCSVDVYRPAAREQLHTIASAQGLACFESLSAQPLDIAQQALAWAQSKGSDVLVIDTAGRLHTDEEMMAELVALKKSMNPSEILLVADSMTGQDAVRLASTFHETLNLTGLILTRMDGDARGGAVLSMRAVTECPIKFLGVGEKAQALEVFHPDRVARRILGMGDVLSLIEQASAELHDEEDAAVMAQRAAKGVFDLNDMLAQMLRLQKMGGVRHLMKMLPGGAALQQSANALIGGEEETRLNMAIIRAMTPQERANPKIINGSRRRRIAQGTGTQVMMVNRLLKKHQMFLDIARRMRDPKALQRQGLGPWLRK